MRRVALLLVLAVAAGCGGPYKGKPERLPKVKKSKEPDAVADAPVDVVWDMDCNAKFAEEPKKPPRSASRAQPFVEQADGSLAKATSADDPGVQVNSLVLAIEQYKKALLEDHYHPAATYGLAVAYARVRKKGCTLKLLARLAALENQAGVTPSTVRGLLDSVELEAAFRPFKNEAMAAIGR